MNETIEFEDWKDLSIFDVVARAVKEVYTIDCLTQYIHCCDLTFENIGLLIVVSVWKFF
jgi:hypothetical protein